MLRFRAHLCGLFASLILSALQVSFAQEVNRQEVMVTMRDGVSLATNLYFLPDGEGSWPVVLTRTPYNKNGGDRGAETYNTRGYALVSQDVRGRYASEGVDQPFEVDMPDGYDTVEWIAEQEWSNGKIGIFGTSAPGITSNLAAAAAPPHLTAAYVTVAPDSLFYRSRFVGGQNLGRDVGPRDQREIGQRQDYLRFQTPVLEEDLVIAGHIDMELYASTDKLDTDFVVKLVDIYPDGYEALILDYPIRMRFRDGQQPGQVGLAEPGKIEKLLINMWSTAQTFERGHRIGIHVSSSNYPRFAVNPNNGADLDDNDSPAEVATNTIYFDARRPSAIILPVVTEEL